MPLWIVLPISNYPPIEKMVSWWPEVFSVKRKLIYLGKQSVATMPWINPPPQGMMAKVYRDYREILALDDIHVVDFTPRSEDRLPILYDCLLAEKHTLSQKPFVLDLEERKKLAELTNQKRVKLAVNQNGR